MISERKLKEWRRRALDAQQESAETLSLYEGTAPGLAKVYIEDQEKILKMTQTLLDQHLLQKKGKE